METTRLSSKGRAIIPKAVRKAYGWEPGTKFSVDALGEGIVRRPLKPFQRSSLKEVLGCIGYEGPRRSLKEMGAAIAKGAREKA